MSAVNTVIIAAILLPWLIILGAEFITSRDHDDRSMILITMLSLITTVFWL